MPLYHSGQRNMVLHLLAVLIALFLPLHASFAQTYFFEKYNVEEGLSSSKVYTILQDSKDHVWLGTESGVSRFDGTKFTNFNPSYGLAPGGVCSMCQDSTGRIWFGHLNGGLSCFDGEKFSRVKFDSIKVSSDITSIKQTNGYLWITTSGDGAIRITFPDQGDTIASGKQYRGKEGLSDQVFKMYVDHEGNIYCITDAFIKKFVPDSDSFVTYSPQGLTNYFMVIVMFEDSKGNFWYGTHNGGLYMSEKSTGKMKIYDSGRDGLAKNYITAITEDYKGNVWVGTWGGGVTVFSGDKIKVFNKSNGLNALYVQDIVEDREKNILIADHSEGLSIFKGEYLTHYSDNRYLSDPDVWAISQDNKGYYWFGTNTGISVYNPADTTSKAVTKYAETKDIIGNRIRFIKNDHHGNMWIGTDGNGIFRYDIAASKFVYDIEQNQNLGNDRTITALETDKNNNIWIGTNDGIASWKANTENSFRYYSQGNGLRGNFITVLYCDKQGILWIGSERPNGLTKFWPETGKFKIVDLGEDIIPRTICQTDDGRIWLGTTAGIVVLTDEKISLTLTKEKNSLLSDNIKLLQTDGSKFMYIGTNQGLNRYDLTNGTIASFTKHNGFTGIESRNNAVFTDNEGNIWFGTANGVTKLNPEEVHPSITTPLTHISQFDVSYKPRKMHDGMKLNYNEKSFIFSYYSVCLTNPEAVKYMFRLKGNDADWRPPTDQTSAIYSALSPGHYTFMVKASDSDGYWNQEPETFSFQITPPFYESFWFISICLLIAVISVISYIKMREEKLRKEKQMLEDKVEERTAEVVQKSLEIEEKNRDITASIRYAERIQRAMLPPEDTFNDTFVLFMPKDIVSGDFFWMFDGGNRKYIAVVDCTGHGVPGAFMSIIGHNSLNKIVREYSVTKPSEILNHLHEEVVQALLQHTDRAVRDGMDISLIVYDTDTGMVEYAGAFHPLYHVHNGVVDTIRADRFSIGFSETWESVYFTNHIIKVEKGDMLYMCSDGYADQFGGGNDRKFKTGRIKDLLLRIYLEPVEKQKEETQRTIVEWMDGSQQVDDILFIGTRVN
jgi:ligand-binding sensor domain-containing protein/serine phosphatase RsbU (regulator of sigma subunit)